MPIVNKEIRGQTIQVLHFEAGMQQAVVDLDITSEMSVYLCGLIRFGRNITINYGDILKHKGYIEGFVLVARTGKGQVVGKVAVGVKQVNLFNKKQKVAYIFDMRIDAKYQRGGVGRLMYEAIEIESQNYKCTGFVCSVNANNQKSLNFFMKTNKFYAGSERKIYSFSPTNLEFKKEDHKQLKNGSLCKLEFFEKGSDRISLDSKQCDYCLLNVNEYAKSKSYLGMVKATNEGNSAQFHIYQGDKDFGMTIQRFFLTPQSWSQWYIKLLVMIILLLVPVGMILGSINFMTNSISSNWLLGLGIALGVFVIVLQILFYYALRIVNSPYLRIFGYEYKGEKKSQAELLTQLIEYIKRYAYSVEAGTVRINEDVRAPYLELIKTQLTTFGPKITAIFLYKLNRASQDRMFSAINQFDPRDM